MTRHHGPDDDIGAAPAPAPAAAAAPAGAPAVPTTIDEGVRRLITKTAEWTAQKGAEFEKYTREMNKDNPRCRFLFEVDSPEAALYKAEVARFAAAAAASAATTSTEAPTTNEHDASSTLTPSSAPTPPAPAAISALHKQAVADAIARSQAHARAIQDRITQQAQSRGGGSEAPAHQQSPSSGDKTRHRHPTSSSTITSDVPHPGMVRVGKVWMYPEDEDTSQGTWEHQRRLQEMRETEERERARQQALLSTTDKKRRHHIDDFLPKEELEKFSKKAHLARAGETYNPMDDDPSKITSSNVGFQMLSRMGWQEGQGLGASASGTVNPINVSTDRPERAGLGQERPDEPQGQDDEFDSYRRRMMLAYKYRPNPLNNPRRSYY